VQNGRNRKPILTTEITEKKTEKSKKQGTTDFTDYTDFVGAHGGAPKKKQETKNLTQPQMDADAHR
jgi:hypothetical protein